MTTIKIEQARLMFPRFYTPKAFEGRDKYGCGFSVTEEQKRDLQAQGLRYNANHDIFNSTSNYAPTITDTNGNYDELLKTYQICDARNLDRDRLFINFVCDITIALFEYSSNFGTPNGETQTGIGCALVEVVVNSRALYGRAIKFNPQDYANKNNS